MTGKDYYQILGVTESASKDEIKKAFKRLARQYHPDRNKAADAEQKFKEINEAHQVLADDKKRAEYDNFRRYGGMGGFGGFGRGARARGGSAADFGPSIDDIFGSMFGGGGDPFGRRARGGGGGTRRETRGRDVQSRIRVPFDVALHGGTMAFRFKREAPCGTCNGSGAAPGSKTITCQQCHGNGHVAVGGGLFTVSRPCPACGGRGETTDKPCGTCSGRGSVLRDQEVEVTIPAGVASGQTIRLSGLGHAGPNGTPSGDLLLEVQVDERAGFRREGRNIHSDVTVPMVDAALGTRVDVATVDGTVELAIPPGTQSGATLRLRGKGFPGPGSSRGDHLVHLTVQIPTDLTGAQREALEAFRKATAT